VPVGVNGALPLFRASNSIDVSGATHSLGYSSARIRALAVVAPDGAAQPRAAKP
jgi:hypothetical protein